MKELLEYIAKTLVSKPEEVYINEISGDDSIILELTVAKDDMGKVIGRNGRIAKAIRSVMRAASLKENKHVIVEIV